MKEKIKINALIDQNKVKLTSHERAGIVEDLKKIYTYEQISKMTGVPKTTLIHWRKSSSRDPNDITENTYVSFLYTINKRLNDFSNLEIDKRKADIIDLSKQIMMKLRVLKE